MVIDLPKGEWEPWGGNGEEALMCNKPIALCVSGFKEAKKLFFLFSETVLWFIVLLLYYFSFLLLYPKDSHRILAIPIIIVFFMLSHKCVEHLLIKLYLYVFPKQPRNSNKLTASLGFIDRLIYAICFAFTQYGFIAVWLGIKIAQRLVQFKSVESTEHEKIKEIGEKKNIFLISNLASLILGIMAGYLIINWFNLPKPNFFK